MYRISGFEGVEVYFTKEIKDCYLLAFESTGMSCIIIIGKGWTGGLKISSRMTFDQPSVGRDFSKFDIFLTRN